MVSVFLQTKQELIQSIDNYVKIKILLPAEAISGCVIEDNKIVKNDVIVVYAW
jgi:hypothetical protein